MHFLIDGYNLLHALGLLAGREGRDRLQRARLSLLNRLAAARAGRADDFTVVFDSAQPPPHAPDATVHKGIHVLFATEDHLADDCIERLLRSESNPRNLSVVSNDHRLLRAAGLRGCAGIRCGEFLDWLERPASPPPSAQQSVAEKPDPPSASQVERWLREFGELDADLTDETG